MDSHAIPTQRSTMPVRKFRLGEEPRDDLTPSTTAAERFERVIELSTRSCSKGSLTLQGNSARTPSPIGIPIQSSTKPWV